jgi:hypothetical protein
MMGAFGKPTFRRNQWSERTKLLADQGSGHSEMFKIFGSLHDANTLQRNVAASHDAVHHCDDEERCQRVDAEPRKEDDRGSEGGEEEDIISSDAVGES